MLVALAVLADTSVRAAQPPTYKGAYTAYDGGDAETAHKRWKRLARRGDADAQFALGVLAYTAPTDAADPTQALSWFLKAARGGHAAAMFNAGVLYWNGSATIPRDRARAVRWWRRATDHDDAAASYNLGAAYLTGQGIEKDPAQAAYWLRRAVALGYRQADAALLRLGEEHPELGSAEPTTVAGSSPNDSATPAATENRGDPGSMPSVQAPTNPAPVDDSPVARKPDTPGLDPKAPAEAAVTALTDVPPSAPELETRNRIGPAGAPVYALADPTSPTVAELDAGTPVRLIEESGQWTRVEVPGGLRLWAHSSYVDRIGDVARIRIDNLNARPRPSSGSDAPPLGRLPQGIAVPVLDESDGWLKIRAPESLGAWVPLARIESVEIDAMRWDRLWQQWARRRVSTPATTHD